MSKGSFPRDPGHGTLWYRGACGSARRRRRHAVAVKPACRIEWLAWRDMNDTTTTSTTLPAAANPKRPHLRKDKRQAPLSPTGL